MKEKVNKSYNYFTCQHMHSRILWFICAVFLACPNVYAQSKGVDTAKGSLGHSDPAINYDDKGIFPFVGEVSIDKVNVRAGQSENFEKLCELKKGDLVVVVDKGYSWYKIEMPDSAKSYVSSDFIQLLGKDTAEVIGHRVNIRSGMGTNHFVLGQLKKGDKINILEELDQWYRIKPVQGTYGWVSTEYIAFRGKDVEGLKKTLSIQKQEETKTPEEKKPVPEVVKKEALIEQKEAKVEKPDSLIVNKDGTVSITGYLKPQKDSSLEYVQYKLETDNDTFCFIEGFKYIFDEFLGYKVTVNGTLNKDLEKKYKHPVITVNKIELVL